MKDRELTRLLQAHPEEGLEAAMLEYAPLVKGILCRILPQNPCDREECMADVFVALWRSAAKLEAARTPLRPWLAVADQDIFLRKYYLLQSGKEIAAALGMSVESVNTRLSRGRDRLRRELTEKRVYSHA